MAQTASADDSYPSVAVPAFDAPSDGPPQSVGAAQGGDVGKIVGVKPDWDMRGHFATHDAAVNEIEGVADRTTLGHFSGVRDVELVLYQAANQVLPQGRLARQ